MRRDAAGREGTGALEVARLIQRKEASPVEILDAYLARIDRLDAEINAIVWRNDDEARTEARQVADLLATSDEPLPSFVGVPIPIKDLHAAAGQPLTYSSWGASPELARESELAVDALRAGGFILTGRTNTPEMGPLTATENDRYGITRNHGT